MAQGGFIISLDFELHWGLRDVVPLEQAKDHFLRARESIPAVLNLFAQHGVHATWATVGFLFAKNKRHLLDHLPTRRPQYTNRDLSPYPLVEEIGEDERSDPFHFAPSLLETIAGVPGQEIASHTFSHFYCLEEGQTEEDFEADLQAAAAIGERFGKVTSSLVFPRGQYNPAYDAAVSRHGVVAYRVPASFYPYRPRRKSEERLVHRGLRLLDSYISLGGAGSNETPHAGAGPVSLPAGSFLRPYAPSRAALEEIRIRRITRAMRDAARGGRDFHLWWHPHNFGSYTGQNLAALGAILQEYRALRESHGWPSRNMAEAAAHARGDR